MLTALAATLLTISTASPAMPVESPAENASAFSKIGGSTLATVMPTPGAWTLMGMGGLALIRARRVKP